MGPEAQNAIADRPAATAPVLVDVLEEHLDELALLAIQRRRLLFSPEASLRRIREHEDRIEAHRDGLRVGGETSVRLALQRLDGDDPWFIAAAARVWVEQSDTPRDEFARRLASVPPELRPSWREALRSCERVCIERLLPTDGWRSLPAAALALAADAAGWHGLLPPDSAHALTAHAENDVRRAVARHAREEHVLRALLEDRDVIVGRAALWSLALARTDAGLEVARAWCDRAAPDAFALRVVGLLGAGLDGDRIAAHLDHPTSRLAAIHALGDLGSLRFAELIVQRLASAEEQVAEAAREAFEQLAGRASTSGDDPVAGARARIEKLNQETDASGRWMRGAHSPWRGNATDEPMQWRWRRLVFTVPSDDEVSRRQVPDGFFRGVPRDVADPGE